MKNRISLIMLLALLSSSTLSASGPKDLKENANIDNEQQQLRWCFLFSNMLGFNIAYISNPRLYQMVGEWLGTPYKYSGQSKKGVDCSGLVCEFYRDCYNKPMNGSARDIFKNVTPIKRSDLREGDLVFFKIKSNRISHIGIFLGQNRFVHASSQNGVIISDLSDSYYNKYFYKGGRTNN